MEFWIYPSFLAVCGASHCRTTSGTLQSFRKFISPLNAFTKRLKGGSREFPPADGHLSIFASRAFQSCLGAQINEGCEAAGVTCFRVFTFDTASAAGEGKKWIATKDCNVVFCCDQGVGMGGLSHKCRSINCTGAGSSSFPAEELWISPVRSCRLRYSEWVFSTAVPINPAQSFDTLGKKTEYIKRSIFTLACTYLF